ncbi:MAG: PadR family transcriptional regulator [Ruminococcus sp.]|nr:PadR family transcriptional regulator [Ruminococcus sp.]MDE6678193.1 PadR family transcriptional regulator [Ruminococcus sp.]
MRVRENLKRGTVEMVLLHLLSEREMYGYEILSEMKERSNGQFAIKDGSMYPILYRMIDKGFIEDEQVLVGRRRTRVYYHITELGKEHLETIKEEYKAVTKGITELLDSHVTLPSSRPANK